MPIETQDLLSYMGISDVDSVDEFKEKFASTYIKQDPQAIKDNKELYGKVTGNYNEANKVAFKRMAKQYGVDLAGIELDKMNIGEVIETALPKAFENYTSQINTLKETSGKGESEQVKAIQDAFEKYKAEVEPKVQTLEKVTNEYSTFKQAVEQKEIEGKINAYKSEAWSKFPFSKTANPYTQKGFIGEVESKFPVKIFDDGNPYPVNEKGERIPDPSKNGAYKSLAQLIDEAGDEANKAGAGIKAVTEQNRPLVTTPKQFKIETPAGGEPSGRKMNTGTRSRTAA